MDVSVALPSLRRQTRFGTTDIGNVQAGQGIVNPEVPTLE
jgi:hypothetical protein